MGSETKSRYAAWMKQTISVQKPLVAVLAALMIGLLTADYFLLLQVRKADLAARARTMSLALKVGEAVPPLDGVALDGTPVNIPYAGDKRHTIIFVFSTSCLICAANWPNWKELAEHIDANRYRVVYANLSDSLSRSYVEDHHLAGAVVVAKVDPRTSQAYSLWFTPAALLISPSGRVERVSPGRLRGEDVSDWKKLLAASANGSDRRHFEAR